MPIPFGVCCLVVAVPNTLRRIDIQSPMCLWCLAEAGTVTINNMKRRNQKQSTHNKFELFHWVARASVCEAECREGRVHSSLLEKKSFSRKLNLKIQFRIFVPFSTLLMFRRREASISYHWSVSKVTTAPGLKLHCRPIYNLNCGAQMERTFE